MKEKGSFAALGIALFVGVACMGCGEEENETQSVIKLGVMTSLSGNSGYIGDGVVNAARMVQKEINDAGGINGSAIELLIRDDRCEKNHGSPGARELLEEGAVAIMGGGCSGPTISALEDVMIPANKVIMSNAASSPALTEFGKTTKLFYRIAPSDAFAGKIIARQVWAQKLAKTAVIYMDNAYGSGIASTFKAAYESLGGRVITFVKYADGKSSDFAAEVRALFAEGDPDAILLSGYVVDVAAVTRDIRSIRNPPSTIKYFSNDNVYDPGFLMNADATIVDGLQGLSPAMNASDENYQRYHDAYVAEVRAKPPQWSGHAYDAVFLMSLAFIAGGEASTAAIQDHMRDLSMANAASDERVDFGEFKRAAELVRAGKDIDYHGVSGPIDLDENGDPTSGFYQWWKVQNNDFVTVEEIAYP